MSDRGDKLHAAIMNLPCGIKGELWPNILDAYRSGHRDARHAAAELVSAAWSARDSEVERLREALKGATWGLRNLLLDDSPSASTERLRLIGVAESLLSSQDKESA